MKHLYSVLEYVPQILNDWFDSRLRRQNQVESKSHKVNSRLSWNCGSLCGDGTASANGLAEKHWGKSPNEAVSEIYSVEPEHGAWA